jgi:hypothetical protein
MSFREYLTEFGNHKSLSVLPVREYVKGGTIAKNAISAADFFSVGKKPDGCVILQNRKDKKLVLVYTSGSGAKMLTSAEKRSDGNKHILENDQTSRFIGEFLSVGSFDYNSEGVISNLVGAVETDKIKTAYVFK